MTTTKLKSATKNQILTSKGKVSKHITNALLNCNFDYENRKIYTGYYSGSGRFTSANSAMKTVTDLLNAQGYKYTTGNDAPRGGASGEYIKVSKTAFNFIQQISNL